ncbi:MAG: tRNA (adenosine(37)-N6)-threonylcarbamoyltransferase complex transferase subunit TsaD [Bordetella sp.]|nr:MAG: tRNA (adenosine(37)-N6)-threonylcarbamoyltransferase complex transferase subunit TsaD [Bordetella sp.]
MIILGLESSCDETGAAIFCTTKGLISHAVHSQIEIHKNYGGVVPELASRDHIYRIIPLVKKVLKLGNLDINDIDAIAYTAGPGLAGCLLIATTIAQAISWAREIPMVPIHHLEGHFLSPLLSEPKPNFPFLSLLVSGGHTQLIHVHDIGKYTLLGETLDDAVGEAFDKIAKLLGLNYPGGASLEKLAKLGNPDAIVLPKPLIYKPNLDFSFSGLKTAVYKKIKTFSSPINDNIRADLAAAVQYTITNLLIIKSIKALKKTKLQNFTIVGGVGSNMFLRKEFKKALKPMNTNIFFPSMNFCTDNAAMIALAGAKRIDKGLVSFDLNVKNNKYFDIKPRWDIRNL